MSKEVAQGQKLSNKGNTTKLRSELVINQQRQVILYTAADGKVTVNVVFSQDNFWMTQKTIAELFGVKIPAISKHLKNIYASQELSEESTVSKMEIVQTEGGREILREIELYNLDAAIAVFASAQPLLLPYAF